MISVKHMESEGKVFVSIRPQNEMLDEVKVPFNQFYDSGLKELA